MSLHFDDESHIYFWNGEKVAGVTSVLGWVNPSIAQYSTEWHRDRGTAVHKCIDLWLQNRLDESTIDPQLEGHWRAWLKFVTDTGFKPVHYLCEQPQYHELYRYAGRPDLIGVINGRYVLLEIKSGGFGMADLQTAAYAQFEEISMWEPDRFGLQLKNDGTYKLEPYKDVSDFPKFLKHLKAYRSAGEV